MSPVTEKTVEVERRVNGSPNEAFAYFTDPAKHVQWQGAWVDLDPRPGGAYVVHFNEQSRIRGEYVVVDEPNRLVFTWGWESQDQFPDGMREIEASSTTVEVVFVPDGEATIIRLRHTQLPTEPAFGATTFGWSVYLDRLQQLLAGEGLWPDPSPPFLATLPSGP